MESFLRSRMSVTEYEDFRQQVESELQGIGPEGLSERNSYQFVKRTVPLIRSTGLAWASCPMGIGGEILMGAGSLAVLLSVPYLGDGTDAERSRASAIFLGGQGVAILGVVLRWFLRLTTAGSHKGTLSKQDRRVRVRVKARVPPGGKRAIKSWSSLRKASPFLAVFSPLSVPKKKNSDHRMDHHQRREFGVPGSYLLRVREEKGFDNLRAAGECSLKRRNSPSRGSSL